VPERPSIYHTSLRRFSPIKSDAALVSAEVLSHA
jgi:hypothetical protein